MEAGPPHPKNWTEGHGLTDFPPQILTELAVHRKKVHEVRRWLEQAFTGNDPKRLLILKGPAGAGKTITLQMLANAMKLHLSEWRNPVGSDYSSEEYIPTSASFDDFLSRSGKFSSLDLDNGLYDKGFILSSSPNPPQIYLDRGIP